MRQEAGLFVASGTMSNAIALKTHTQPGDEIVTWKESHIYVYEGGGYAALCGCSVALVDGNRGIMNPQDVKNAIRKTAGSQGHYPNGSLVCVENTSNRGEELVILRIHWMKLLKSQRKMVVNHILTVLGFSMQ